MNDIYFKITNIIENHHGVQYHDGIVLNINPQIHTTTPIEFNSTPIVGDGIHFSDKDNIHYFYNYGVWIRRIKPLGKDIIEINDPTISIGKIYKAEKIEMDKRYHLADPKTWKILDIPPPSIRWASCKGFVEVVKYWIKKRPDDISDEDIGKTIDYASQNNHTDILDFLFDVLPIDKLNYSEYSMDYASHERAFYSLNWWIRNYVGLGVSLKYSTKALKFATENGYIDVLNWWLEQHKKYNIELKYDKHEIENILLFSQSKIIDWWNDLPFFSKHL